MSNLYNIEIRKKINMVKIKQPKNLKNKKLIEHNYCVTPKFDGVRALLFITEDKNVFLIKNNLSVIISTNLKSIKDCNTIIDGELIDDKVFYAIDLICYNNNLLESYNLIERIELLKK